jgi:hypothetical protein
MTAAISRLRFLPPKMACLPIPERWTSQPGWNAGAAKVRLAEAAKYPEHSSQYRAEMARAAEFERLEALTRQMGVCSK